MAEAHSAGPRLGISERSLLFLITAVQFINVLEFMIVSPLGPDFAKDLGISLSQLGLLGGSYTASAAVAGALGSKYLDRFDRRTALGVALAVIADVVPSRRRGQALGMVMSGFAAASVFGVPLSLELARQVNWRAPFFAVALLGVVVGIFAITSLPELRLHMHATGERSRIFDFLGERAVLFSLSATFSVMVSSFCIIPNLSAYLQHNCGYPRSQLSFLYLIGGSVSFVITRVVGGYVDRIGATRVAAVGSGLFVLVLIPVFIFEQRWLSSLLAFSLFMAATAIRNVSINALTSRVPQPHERARFMSLQSAMQHLAAAGGAGLGSLLLSELPNGQLGGMPRVAAISVAFAALLPGLLWQVERVIRMRRPSLPEPWMNTLEATRSSFPPPV